MAGDRSSRRWRAIGGALAIAFCQLAALSGCASEHSQAEQAAAASPAADANSDGAANAGQGGRGERRIAEGCKPKEASLEYEDYAGARALAILSWNGMSERAANLKIPVFVVAIEDGSIGVRFLEFPMREQYLNIWLGSGHIAAG
jgi:hypothetical protein